MMNEETIIEQLEEMIERRMVNTGETRDEACNHILAYLTNTTNWVTSSLPMTFI